jgi:hypothetical protein
MGTYPTDNDEVTTATELLRSHEKEQVKQHVVFDAQDRPKYVFTAAISAEDGDPCLVMEYVYRDATSTQIMDRQERTYAWKSAWDANFAFNPATSYDADGDGVL